MATQSQIDANRANAQHSTGPVTPEGKLASSQNATRHGAYSTQTLIPGEDPAERAALLIEYQKACKPVGPLESHAVDTLTDCKWKLRRLTRIEDATYSLYTITLAEELAALPADPNIHLAYMLQYDAINSKMLKRIPQQEARLHRLYAQSMKELRALQAARHAESKDATSVVTNQTQSDPETEPLHPCDPPLAADPNTPRQAEGPRIEPGEIQ